MYPFILIALGILVQWLASSRKIYRILYIVSGTIITFSTLNLAPLFYPIHMSSYINTTILLSFGCGILNYYIFGKSSTIVLPFAFVFILSALLIVIYKDILLIDNYNLRVFPYILALTFFIVFFVMALPSKKKRR